MKKIKTLCMVVGLSIGSYFSSLNAERIEDKKPDVILNEWESQIRRWPLCAHADSVKRDCPDLFKVLKRVVDNDKWDKEAWTKWCDTLQKWGIKLTDIKEDIMKYSQIIALGKLLYNIPTTSERGIFFLGAALQIKYEKTIRNLA